MLSVSNAVHSFPLENMGKNFPCTDDETRRHFSNLSFAFESLAYQITKKSYITNYSAYMNIVILQPPLSGCKIIIIIIIIIINK